MPLSSLNYLSFNRRKNVPGPQDELEYWKKRGARFSQIVGQVNSNEVQLTILCLKISHAKIIKDWKETDKKITFCYNEAKDNAKFIQALESKCHSLYLDDPVGISETDTWKALNISTPFGISLIVAIFLSLHDNNTHQTGLEKFDVDFLSQ